MPAALELRDISDDERKTAKASDFAGKNKSFPLLKAEDVAAAAASIGRAGTDNYSSDELKARIIRIAKRKGAAFVAQLPKAWRDEKSLAVQLPGQAITLAADDSGEGPASTWIQVLRVGKFWSVRYKDFSVTKATLRRMVENFQTYTPKDPTELPLDYNHGTNHPDTVEQGKAAGWIKTVELREDGSELWAFVELTPEAAALVRNKEYRFVSATFEFDHVHTDGDDRKKAIGPTLMAAALTNTPFVEGMQPVTLGKATAAIALEDDEAAETTFSYDEQRRRVQAALSEAFGTAGYSSCCAPCYGVYLVDLFDGYAIYAEDGGCKYRVDFTFGSDGTVTFTTEAVEVRVDYVPLPSAEPADSSGANEMATIKVKDAKGNEIELAEETVKQLAKQHAPAAADTTAIDEMATRLTKTESEVVDLKKRNEQLETEKQELAARGLVDALIRAGKVPPKKRDQYVTLAMKDRKTFTELTSDLPVIYATGGEAGSGADGEQVSATVEAEALAREEMKTDAKLTLSAAFDRVFAKQPVLYDRYKREATVRA